MVDTRFFTQQRQYISLGEIADITGANVKDNNAEGIYIYGVAPLDTAGQDCVSFLDNVRYRDKLAQTQAGACFVNAAAADMVPESTYALVTPAPYKAYALTAQAFYGQDTDFIAHCSSSARIHSDAKIGENCFIGDNVVIEKGASIGGNTRIMAGSFIDANVEIGRNCHIHPNVSITCTLMGNNVTVFPGTCIGQDGFGFAIAPEGYIKMPQLGRVLIKDDVVIGANTTIDRGSGPDTVIDAGTWIDNLVQIGHNVVIGRMCVIVAQCGISGSTRLGDRVMLGGQSGIAGHLIIGDDARVAANAGVMRDVEPGQEVMGAPAFEKTAFMRQTALLKRSADKSNHKS